MTNKFNIGDKVKVVRSYPHGKYELPSFTNEWTKDMNAHVGNKKEYIVQAVSKKGVLLNGVREFPPSCLELVKRADKFKVGDKVKITHGLKHDYYCMESFGNSWTAGMDEYVNNGVTYTITEIGPIGVTLDYCTYVFPGFCLTHAKDVVESKQVKTQAKKKKPVYPKLKVGDKVRVVRAYEHRYYNFKNFDNVWVYWMDKIVNNGVAYEVIDIDSGGVLLNTEINGYTNYKFPPACLEKITSAQKAALEVAKKKPTVDKTGEPLSVYDMYVDAAMTLLHRAIRHKLLSVEVEINDTYTSVEFLKTKQVFRIYHNHSVDKEFNGMIFRRFVEACNGKH